MAMATTFAPLPEAEQSAQLRKAVIAFANLVSQLPIAMPRPCPKFNLGRPKLFRAPVASPPCNRNTVCAISCFLSPSLPPSALSQRSLYSAPKSRLGTQERHRQLNVFDERPRRQDCRRSGMETFAQLKSSGPPKLMPAMRRCRLATGRSDRNSGRNLLGARQAQSRPPDPSYGVSERAIYENDSRSKRGYPLNQTASFQ
jgi:hypothetical protein